MKPTLFAATTAMMLLTTATSNAGPGHRYITEVGRNIGYGISDGYHAQRYCLPAGSTCSSCSPAQQPMMQQPMMQQYMQQPVMVPAYQQWAPQQFQQVGYPLGYPVAPVYQPYYQPIAPSYAQPPAVVRPNRNPASLW